MGLRRKKSLADKLKEQASDSLGSAVDAVRPTAEAAYDATRDFVQETALPALSDAYDRTESLAKDAAKDARKQAGPALSDARDKSASLAKDAREAAAPVVASGAAVAAERASAARGLAESKVAELRGEPEPKRSKVKTFLLIAAVGGAVAVVAKKLQGGSSTTDNWQTSYTPSPAPAPAAPASPSAPQAGVEDPTGSSLDEGLADAVEAPHDVTTPDQPAEVVEVEDDKK